MSKKQALSARLREYITIVEGADYLARNISSHYRNKAVHPEYLRGVYEGVSLCIKRLCLSFPEIQFRKDKKI